MRILIILFIVFVLASCRTLNPHVMFDVPKNYPYATDSLGSKNKEYLIAPKDRMEMHLYSIDGFRLVDVTNTSSSGVGAEAITYIVEEDGLVKLPIIGKVYMAGLTMRQAERFLEEKYSTYYINPFIMLKVTNRHCYVFYGDVGRGAIVNIVNDNTSVIEAIALAGGLTDDSKAWRIKVIRGDLHNPQIHIIDLSTIAGIKSSDLSIQSNDIIYIEATPNYKQKVLAQLTPFVGILTAVLLVVTLVKK
jgi:polysaccharide export outer membrane protein